MFSSTFVQVFEKLQAVSRSGWSIARFCSTHPPVEVPTFPASPGVEHNGGVPLVLPSGDVNLAYLRVAADSQVIAQGPCNLVVNDLTLSPGASLEFDTQLGPIRVWVRGSLTMNDGSEISCSDTDTSTS